MCVDAHGYLGNVGIFGIRLQKKLHFETNFCMNTHKKAIRHLSSCADLNMRYLPLLVISCSY